MIDAHDVEHSKAADSAVPTRGPVWLDAIAGAALGCVAAAGIAVTGDPVYANAVYVLGAIVIAAVFAIAASVAGGRALIPVGVLLFAIGAWLLTQVSWAAGALFIAPLVGIGAGMAAPGVPARTPRRAGGAFAAAAIVVLVRLALGRDAAMLAGAIVVAAAGVAAWLRHAGTAASPARVAGLALAGALVALVTVAWTGANIPTATWFGALTSHGPRTSNEVAITFDDGPNAPYTMQIAALLDAAGAKGTFFEVGKAIDADPGTARALMADGHLLGNHSYHHDAVRWLDPRYPELADTQDAFRRNLGVCPAFFRPPHGTHTPFMAHAVEDRDMKMVTWDVSAGDWATEDGQLVARRVLDRVQPGSIILLHDGIDGNPGADRSVILTALPLILDGLKERGLTPVTLDKLLGVPGYLPSC